MRYKLPEKEIDRVIEIEGFDPFELPKISFAERMDFLAWLDKNKTHNSSMILEEVIRTALPENLADAVLGAENMIFISKIYMQIVSVKLGMTIEEYMEQSEKQM